MTTNSTDLSFDSTTPTPLSVQDSPAVTQICDPTSEICIVEEEHPTSTIDLATAENLLPQIAGARVITSNVDFRFQIVRGTTATPADSSVTLTLYTIDYAEDAEISTPTLIPAGETAYLSLGTTTATPDQSGSAPSQITVELGDQPETFAIRITRQEPGTQFYLLVANGQDATGASVQTHALFILR